MGLPSFQSAMRSYTQSVLTFSWDIWLQISPCFKVLSSAPFSSPLPQERTFSWILLKVVILPMPFTESKLVRIPWKWHWDWGLWARQRGVCTINCSEVRGEKEVQLVNTGRVCDKKFVLIQRRAQRHKCRKVPMVQSEAVPALAQECLSPMGQEWHQWVQCPESQDTLWDAKEGLPGTVHDL